MAIPSLLPIDIPRHHLISDEATIFFGIPITTGSCAGGRYNFTNPENIKEVLMAAKATNSITMICPRCHQEVDTPVG